MEPRRLGRYEIVRPLKRGGMAELFLARSIGHEGVEKRVVVKRILPEMAGDAEYVAMFLEEARLAVALQHANIVHAWDVGEADGSPFYAMEFLDGEDVHGLQRVLAGPMPLEHALAIAMGASAGLHHAHELRDGAGRGLGIVHRDVSPHNIAVTFDGGVKLLDFGVAKSRRRSLTRHGTLKGKVGYMSPEQCRGDELDRRSDVFAVGVVLWELIAGRRLFGGRSDFGVMRSIVDVDAPPPPGCPPELEAIVMRALRRDREARFATAEELQLALEGFARERRLAVSGVGLGRFLRERLGARVEAPLANDRTTSLYGAGVDDDGAEATIVDGAIAPEPPRRRTRALAPRRRRWPLAVALATLALMVGGAFLALERPPAQRVAPVETPRAPAPVEIAAPPPLEPAPPKPETKPEPPPSPTVKAPAPRVHKRPPHPARRSEPERVDLDAPLPPR